jgi:hypothetical protein
MPPPTAGSQALENAVAKRQSALTSRTVRHRSHRELNGAAPAASGAASPGPRPEPLPVAQAAAQGAPPVQPPSGAPPLQTIAAPPVRTGPPSLPASRPPAPHPGNGFAPAQPTHSGASNGAGVSLPAQVPPSPATQPPPMQPQARQASYAAPTGSSPLGAPRPPPVPQGSMPDLSSLPPGVAASLARLAGAQMPPSGGPKSAGQQNPDMPAPPKIPSS